MTMTTKAARRHISASRRGLRLAPAGVGLALLLLFAVPLASAKAPAGRYLVTKTTVKDTKTGLVWQVEVAGTIKGVDHAAAKAFCATSALEGGGWRLPTRKELVTLIDHSVAKPCIDTAAFPWPLYLTGFLFWTATPHGAAESIVVSFEFGNTGSWLIDQPGAARCVR